MLIFDTISDAKSHTAIPIASKVIHSSVMNLPRHYYVYAVYLHNLHKGAAGSSHC